MFRKNKTQVNLTQKYATESLFGTHMCSIYRNIHEQLSVVIPYLLYGLRHNERCVYIVDENTREEICSRLEAFGMQPNERIWAGQLTFLGKDETYLADGFFVPLRMYDLIERAHYQALKGGYLGLRGTGEMTWTLDGHPGSNRLLPYESELNKSFSHRRFVTICQYNEKKFPENVMLGVLYSHPKVIIYGTLYDNPFYIPPERFEEEIGKEYVPGAYQNLRDKIISSAK
jgi:hypothetical protein